MNHRNVIILFLSILSLTGCKKNEPDEPIIPAVEECDKSIEIENDHSIEGYSDKESYFPGDSVHLKIHSLTNFCAIEIIRHGFTNEVIDFYTDVPCSTQNYNCRSYSFGCEWETTFSYKLPSTLSSGIYSAELSNDLGESFNITFIVKGSGGVSYAVLANTNTWQAYNNWSGHSFYSYELNEKRNNSEIISFNRPNLEGTPYGFKGHLAAAELHLLRWMEDNSYDYNVFADRDLHDGSFDLNNYETVVLNVHPEYWTMQMRDALINFLDNGGNLINLGANGIYWKSVILDDKIEKITKNVTFHLDPSQTGGRWRESGLPESEILGVEYDRRGYATWYPYRVYNSSHWIFTGTGLINGDLFGSYSLNGGAASGHETDKMTINSPASSVFLAKGINPEEGGGSMVFYNHPGGGKVFSAGSISYTGSLAVDPVIDQITKNVFDDFQ